LQCRPRAARRPRSGGMGRTGALQRAGTLGARARDRSGLRRLVPPLPATGEVLHVVGLSSGRLPPQHGLEDRPRAAHAGAREGREILRHRRRPAPPRTAIGPRAGGLRPGARGAGARRMSTRAAAPLESERLARLREYGALDPDLAWPALEELVRRARDV